MYYLLDKLSKTEIITDKIKLKAKAHKKLSTTNPLTSASVIRIKKALMINKNNPRVTIVMGMVKMIRTGFRVALNNARIAATINASRKFST